MNLIETYNGSGLYAQYASSADYASNGQPLSAALTAVPDTYLQNTDLTIVDNKITEISGVPLSAGDELPEGLMNTSALEYNAVNEISGYAGSAIAQYGAEKQWLTHDDTIVHVSNSAQYAFGVNVPEVLSASQELIGPKMNEETFAGYWNNQPVYSIMKEVIFNSNVGSSASLPDEVASAAEGRYWIDPSNSFIAYGSQTILLPLSWCLGTGRMGSFNIINGILNYRGFDSAPNTCTAYIAFKYRKA